jgi:hypothetical protein
MKENSMKRTPKKLTLQRETLAGLTRSELEQAAGGFTIRPDECQYSGRKTCLTCEATCTTNYC